MQLNATGRRLRFYGKRLKGNDVMPSKRPLTKRRRDAARPVRSKKQANVRPEDLTLEERIALAEKIEAARQRGRPPSI